MTSPRLAFTLIELLVVVAVVVILVGLLLPALAVVRQHVQRTRASGRLAEIHVAVQAYAAEEPRHRFPPQVADRSLRWDPSGAVPGTLNLLLDRGLVIDLEGLDRGGAAPFPLCDPWHHPFRYQVDGDLTVAGVQRPADPAVCPAWNATGRRPWAYVWSTGAAGQADGSGWLYLRDDR